jgi:hypothetical protein
MTVAELRKKLADFPDDLPVVIAGELGYEPAKSVENIRLQGRSGMLFYVWESDPGGAPHVLIAGI